MESTYSYKNIEQSFKEYATLKKGLGLMEEELVKKKELFDSLQGELHQGLLTRINQENEFLTRKGETVQEAEQLLQKGEYEQAYTILTGKTFSPISTPTYSYKNIEIEPGVKKDFLHYDHPNSRESSLQTLQKEGYERHPHPQELFSLFIDYFEGTLEQKLIPLAEDILNQSYGEWFNIANQRKGNILTIFENPNLIWAPKENIYAPKENQLKFTNKHNFNLNGLPSKTWLDLAQVNEANSDLVVYFTTRPFKDLPDQIRNGTKSISKSQLYLPAKGEIWPVGRGNCYGGRFDFGSCDYNGRTSRGANEKK
ncbi:MAG: hypothetical protein KKG60_03110 [Nanoarchaeota archaeon]|nr:hypothetical protein [Nanoarchaeota archaeon]